MNIAELTIVMQQHDVMQQNADDHSTSFRSIKEHIFSKSVPNVLSIRRTLPCLIACSNCQSVCSPVPKTYLLAVCCWYQKTAFRFAAQNR